MSHRLASAQDALQTSVCQDASWTVVSIMPTDKHLPKMSPDIVCLNPMRQHSYIHRNLGVWCMKQHSYILRNWGSLMLWYLEIKTLIKNTLNFSQIDSDVLHELPAEIAQEILEDLRVRKQRKKSLSTVTPVTAPVHASSRNGSSPVKDSDRCAEGAVIHSGLPSLSQVRLDYRCVAVFSHIVLNFTASFSYFQIERTSLLQ